ncbi:MAG: hypothetical protein AB7O67_22440 [Vicinamibacterales bacterium]
MQERRFRPGDVLDDYCPRERRVTDHAIVAMIDDEIRQTRCVSCDTEHEYKHARVPAQRRRKPDAALFTQVLDGLNSPAARLASRPDDPLPDDASPDSSPDHDREPDAASAPAAWSAPAAPAPAPVETKAEAADGADTETVSGEPDGDQPADDEFPVRRRLFRAQLPRHEGQQVPTRTLPEFTIRQPGSGRGGRPGQGGGGQQPRGQGRRRGGGQQQGGGGQATRFGNRGGGRGQGQFGQGHGQGQGQGQGRRRRGKKK